MLSVVHKHTRDHARYRAQREKKCRQGRPKFRGRRKNMRAHGWARVTRVSRLKEEQPQQYPLVLRIAKLPITFDSMWYKSKGQVCFRGG